MLIQSANSSCQPIRCQQAVKIFTVRECTQCKTLTHTNLRQTLSLAFFSSFLPFLIIYFLLCHYLFFSLFHLSFPLSYSSSFSVIFLLLPSSRSFFVSYFFFIALFLTNCIMFFLSFFLLQMTNILCVCVIYFFWL